MMRETERQELGDGERYWRISPRPMTEADIHDRHVSRLWVDSGDESDTRSGLSCCDSLEGLLSYFCGRAGEHTAGRGAALSGAWLVQLEGEPTGDTPWESEYEPSEALIHPTRIISQEPVTERFVELLREEIERSWCDADERAHHDEESDCYIIETRCDSCDGTGREEDDDGTTDECWRCDGAGWRR